MFDKIIYKICDKVVSICESIKGRIKTTPQKDWLKGYKEIPNPNAPSNSFKSEINWGNWNKEILENKALMQEYNAIEQAAKKDGTWMKNPDGSKFTGTPEQFVQQNSENFKKAFPNPIKDDKGNVQINLHGSPSKFDSFTPNDVFGEYGPGIYTTTDRNYAKAFTSNRSGKPIIEDPIIYELYQNSNLPKTTYKDYKKFVDNEINTFNKKTRFLLKSNKKYKRLNEELDKKLSDAHAKMDDSKAFQLTDGFDSFTKKKSNSSAI